jgi:hypothetical protein
MLGGETACVSNAQEETILVHLPPHMDSQANRMVKWAYEVGGNKDASVYHLCVCNTPRWTAVFSYE